MPPKTPVVLLAKKHSNSHSNNHPANHSNNHAHNHANKQKGLLHVDPAALQNGKQQHQQVYQTQQPHQPKTTVRLKLQLRRLPPQLTKDEFLDALGDEWKVPGDRIDWLEYRPGKTKGPGKLSLQSRAYIHLTSQHHISDFEAKFLSITFHDAKGSFKDTQLKHMPPILTYAPNQRIPSAKLRVDARQGTIDQDPEFIAFLEKETQPVTKPLSLDHAQAQAQEKPKEKLTSTPLLDDLREKKLLKAKANQKQREEKAQDKSASRSRPDKHDSKQPVKLLAKPQKSTPSNSPAPAAQPAQPSPASTRKRDRVAPNQIKSMLQRDLGLNQPSKRSGKEPASNKTSSPAPAPAPAPNQDQSTPPAASTAKPAKPRSRNKDKANPQTQNSENVKPAPAAPTGILKKPQNQPAPKQTKAKAAAAAAAAAAQATPTAATAAVPSPSPSPAPSKQSKAQAHPAAGATKAYLKHANASQGVTEPLLLTALSAFGPVVKVEIDKRKGTALAEFKDTDALKAAMAKKNVTVGQGAVEVLEFREKPGPGGRGAANPARNSTAAPGRGRGRGARGGAANTAGNASTPATKPDAT